MTDRRSEGAARRIALGVVLLAVGFIVFGVLVIGGSTLPVIDEPIFAKSAFEFARTGHIVISGLSSPNAVFDTVWGGLFVEILGPTYAALRLSSIVLSALSIPFMYSLCRSSGASYRSSLLATGSYAFAPLAFTLGVTFQTDAHALALGVIGMALFARALEHESHQIAYLGLSSVLIGLAYLSRQQYLLLTVTAIIAWLTTKPPSARRWTGTAALLTAPLLALTVHQAWTSVVGAPFVRDVSLAAISQRGFEEMTALGAKTIIGGVFYVGLFALSFLPLGIRALWTGNGTRLKLGLGAGMLAVAVGIAAAPHQVVNLTWVSTTGVGAVDGGMLGSRPDLAPKWVIGVVVVVVVSAAYVLTLLVIGGVRNRRGPLQVCLLISLIGFTGLAFLASMAGHRTILDRYWLPLLPLVLALAAGHAQGSPLGLSAGASVLALLAAFAVIGTHDSFQAQSHIARYANDLTGGAIDPLRLDGGASWSADKYGVADNSAEFVVSRPGPFWMKFYAVTSEPRYGLSLSPIPGYDVVEKREFPSLLHAQPTWVYLLHRAGDFYAPSG